jgi:glycolate oxidase
MNAPTTPAQVAQLNRTNRQAEVVRALSAVVPAHALLWQLEDTVPYECDGLTAYRERPLVVVLPETEAQVSAVLKACHALDVPVWRAARAPACRAVPCRMPWASHCR